MSCVSQLVMTAPQLDSEPLAATVGTVMSFGTSPDDFLARLDVMPDRLAADGGYHDALGRIHGAAAAQRDDDVQPFLAHDSRAFVHGGGAGVGLDFIEDGHRDAVLIQVGYGAVEQAAPAHRAFAGDEQGFLADRAGLFAELAEASGAGDDFGGDIKCSSHGNIIANGEFAIAKIRRATGRSPLHLPSGLSERISLNLSFPACGGLKSQGERLDEVTTSRTLTLSPQGRGKTKRAKVEVRDEEWNTILLRLLRFDSRHEIGTSSSQNDGIGLDLESVNLRLAGFEPLLLLLQAHALVGGLVAG